MKMKIGAALALALGGLAFAGSQAAAAPACSTITTVGSFSSGTQCEVGDKLYTSLGSDLPSGTVMSIIQVGQTYVSTQFTITAVGTYFFDYSVEVIGDDFRIVQVDLDSDVAGNDPIDSTVTKQIYSSSDVLIDTIQSLSGGQDESVIFSDTKITVREDIVVASGEAFLSISNDIIQAPTIPAPASLGLFGLALLGLGLMRRKAA